MTFNHSSLRREERFRQFAMWDPQRRGRAGTKTVNAAGRGRALPAEAKLAVRGGPVLRFQIGHELSHFFVGERIAEGRHLLATLYDLVGNARGRPLLAGVEAGERGRLVGAGPRFSMTKRAAFIVEQGCSRLNRGGGFFRRLGGRKPASRHSGYRNESDESEPVASHHEHDSLTRAAQSASAEGRSVSFSI